MKYFIFLTEIVMAKEVVRDPITFYLYDRRWNLIRRPTSIASPFNVKTQWFESHEYDYVDPVIVRFVDWVYRLTEEEVWPEEYDRQKEFLSYYNNVWWRLSKWTWRSAVFNGKWFKWPWYMEVRTDEPKQPVNTVVNTVVKEVQVQTIPRIVAEWMDFKQLKTLAKSWWVEIPEWIEESWTSTQIKDRYLELLDKHLV